MEKVIYEEKHYKLLLPMYFRIYTDKIEACFWPFKYIINFSDIEDIRIIDRVPYYIGWGLRINPLSRTLFFVTHHGRSIEIIKRKGFWKKVILSVKNPEEFMNNFKLFYRK